MKRNLFSLLLSGAIFAGFFLFLNYTLMSSIFIGIGGYIAGRILFRNMKKKEEEKYVSTGITSKMVDKVINEGYEKLKEIRSYSFRMRNQDAKKKVEEIIKVGKKIYDNFREDPKDIKAARQFLNYYIETTIKIIKQYVELAEKRIDTEDVQKTLEKAETILDSIKNAFEVQLSKLQEDNVLDLDTEIQVLQNMIKMEGLEKKEVKKNDKMEKQTEN